MLQDSGSDPRLAAASPSSSGLALEIVGMGAGGAVGAAVAQLKKIKQQQEEEGGGRGMSGWSVAAAAGGGGKALPLSGRRRGAEALQGGVVALTGAMCVEGGEGGAGGGWAGPARGQKEGPLLRRPVGGGDEHEARYR